MGLYDKYARLAGERLQFSDNGLTPFGTCIDEVYSATEGRIGNKKVILAGTNKYLGLTFNHDAIREGQAALAAQGARHHRFSAMANGGYAPRTDVGGEKRLPSFSIALPLSFFQPVIPLSSVSSAHLPTITPWCYWMPTATPVFLTPSSAARRLFVSAIMTSTIWNGAWSASVNGRKRRLLSLKASTVCSVTLRRWQKLLISKTSSRRIFNCR